ncbi:MAG: alpha-amylase family glycosyl hydrolase [Thermoproteus sp.]
MACRIRRWAGHDYFGVVAEVEACTERVGARGYLVSNLSGELIGAFPLEARRGLMCATLHLPPGRYPYKFVVDYNEVGGGECLVRPPSPLLHAPSPYFVGEFKDGVEVRAFAVRSPKICDETACTFGEELAVMDGYSLYRAFVRGPPYVVDCCGIKIRVEKFARFRKPRWAPLVMYEILPDRVKNRFGCGNLRRDFCGGSLDDVGDLLDYISQMGDAVYLHPIYRAMSYHRYDVLDHKSVDDILGGFESFRELLDKTRRRGLGVVLDVVLHHVGLKSRLFSQHESLFYFKNREETRRALEVAYSLPRELWPRFFRGDPPYETFMSVWTMPKIDYSKAEALAYAESVLAFWADKVDGFRFDVAHGIPPAVWRALVGRYLETHYLLAEHTGDPTAYLGVHHGFTAYELYGAVLDFFALDKIEAEEFAKRVKLYIARVGPNQLRYMYTFIENHDTDRFCSVAGRRKRRAVLAYAFIYMMPGTPAVYAGGENCAEGLASDHTNRRPLDSYKPDLELASALRALYLIRRKYPEVAEGPVRHISGRGERLLLENGPITLFLDRKAGYIEIKTPDGYIEL